MKSICDNVINDINFSHFSNFNKTDHTFKRVKVLRRMNVIKIKYTIEIKMAI